jgi:AcrR family transcriptional regulator
MTEPLRSDAQQNRDLLLSVALDALTESSDASLNSIAKRAGVGIGTLYRHFPTREALVLAVYRNEVQHVVDAARTLLDTMPPFEALRAWMELNAHYGMAKAGLADALSSAATSHEELNAETYGPVVGALSMLLEANERAGTVRPNLDPDDVLLMMGFMWRIDPAGDWEAQSRRLLDIMMDGLRAGTPAVSRRTGSAGSPARSTRRGRGASPR